MNRTCLGKITWGVLAGFLVAVLPSACRADVEGRRRAPPVALDSRLYPFGFCLKGISPARQVQVCQRAGFDGLGLVDLDPTQLREFADLPDVSSGRFRIPCVLWWRVVGARLDTAWLDSSLRQANRMKTALWIVAASKEGIGSSEASMRDELDFIATRCDAAKVDLVLYPHAKTWIADVEASLPILAELRRKGHTGVKTSIHLCHEIIAGNGDRLPEIVRESAPYLGLASINGVTRGEVEILPLDRGNYDPKPFLQSLAAMDFTGPMLLHTYRLSSPMARDYDHHLERSLGRWNELVRPSAPVRDSGRH